MANTYDHLYHRLDAYRKKITNQFTEIVESNLL